ncbi:MAG: hypothetical protein ACRCZ2_13385 [Fusobacteriaceae bacterium]
MLPAFTLNPAKPVKFSANAITKVLAQSGSLIADIKLDGVRCELVITPADDGLADCYAMSRSDKPLPALVNLFNEDREALATLLRESPYPDGLIIDGEMLVKGEDFQTGAGMLRRKTSIETERLRYVIYGLLPLQFILENDKRETVDISACFMQARLEVFIHQVKELLPSLSWELVQSYDVFNMESLYELYETVREAGHEGLVLKDPMHPWHRGKKTGWWKMKPEDNIDGRVVGLIWGTEGKKYEGKVIGFEVELEDNGHVVRADGLTDAQIEEYTLKYVEHNMGPTIKPNWPDVVWQPAKGESNPFEHWAIQLKFMERTPDGSLRHPKFDCWRGTESDPTVKS